MRGHVDSLVGVVFVGAGAGIATEARSIRHRSINGVRTKKAMIRAEGIGRALLCIVNADVLISLGEDKENIVDT